MKTRLESLVCIPLWFAVVLGGASATAEEPRYRFEEAFVLSGPCCGDTAHDLDVDSEGSYVIVGAYGALDFDNDGRSDLKSQSGRDPLILKGRPAGPLVWVRAPRASAEAFLPGAVASDRRAGAYMVGVFKGRLQFRSGKSIESRGEQDGYLVRYDAEGEALWARAIGGETENPDSIYDVAADADGNVYVVGTVWGDVDLDGDGVRDVTASSGQGLLIASFDPAGALRWARVPSCSGDTAGRSVDVGEDGGVLIAGRYTGGAIDIDGDGSADLPAPVGDGAPLLARLDTSGALTWARSASGPGGVSIGRLALTGGGDILITGAIQGPADFDSNGSADVDAATGESTVFLARYSKDGSLAWVQALDAPGEWSFWHLAAGKQRIALSGFYRGSLDFDEDGVLDGRADADGKSEGLITILDADGAVEQILTIVGPGADQARAADFSADEKVLWVTGFLRLTADFNGDGKAEGGIRCDSYGDIFGARYELVD